MIDSKTAKIFLAGWQLVAIIAITIPVPVVPALLWIILFGVASWLLFTKVNIRLVLKIYLITLWTIPVLCIAYSFVAFGAMVDASDVMQPDPWWTAGLIPALIMAVIAFALAEFLAINIFRNKTGSRE